LFFNRLIQANFRRERYVLSDETLGYVEAMWTAVQKSDNVGQKYSAQFTFGLSHLWLGNFDEAEKHLNASLTAAERTGDITHQTRCLTYLATLFRRRDQMAKARQYASRALTLATTLQMVEYIATAKANLAWIAWRKENLSEAQEYGQSALELWPEDYPFQWTALWPLIAVALAQGQISEAVDYTRTLLDPVQQRMPDGLTTELEETLLKWKEGQSEKSRIHFDQAVKLAQDLGYL
jgi:tetratricopeptide (TPR) repeat protein